MAGAPGTPGEPRRARRRPRGVRMAALRPAATAPCNAGTRAATAPALHRPQHAPRISRPARPGPQHVHFPEHAEVLARGQARGRRVSAHAAMMRSPGRRAAARAARMRRPSRAAPRRAPGGEAHARAASPRHCSRSAWMAASQASHWHALAGNARSSVGVRPAYSARRPPSRWSSCRLRAMPTSYSDPGPAVCRRVFATSSGSTSARPRAPARYHTACASACGRLRAGLTRRPRHRTEQAGPLRASAGAEQAQLRAGAPPAPWTRAPGAERYPGLGNAEQQET